MIVYHLKGHVYTRQYGELCEKYSHFSDVFPTLGLALETGKQKLKEGMQGLFESQCAYMADQLEDFIKENIEYGFRVHEFDLECKQKMTFREDWENITMDNAIEFSSEIEWNFDRNGELLTRYEMRGAGYDVRPGDYVDDAGTLYKLGSFVMAKNPKSCSFNGDGNSSGIYVVSGAPGRRKDWHSPLHWENIYCLQYSKKGEFSCWDHHHVHETELEAYSGEIPADSFLHVLSKSCKGEPIDSAIAERIKSGATIYVGDLQWHYKFMGKSIILSQE